MTTTLQIIGIQTEAGGALEVTYYVNDREIRGRRFASRGQLADFVAEHLTEEALFAQVLAHWQANDMPLLDDVFATGRLMTFDYGLSTAVTVVVRPTPAPPRGASA